MLFRASRDGRKSAQNIRRRCQGASCWGRAFQQRTTACSLGYLTSVSYRSRPQCSQQSSTSSTRSSWSSCRNSSWNRASSSKLTTPQPQPPPPPPPTHRSVRADTPSSLLEHFPTLGPSCGLEDDVSKLINFSHNSTVAPCDPALYRSVCII